MSRIVIEPFSLACKKKIYFTREEASKALKRIKRQRRKYKAMRIHKECRVYQCPLCQLWHLTSQEKIKDEPVKRKT